MERPVYADYDPRIPLLSKDGVDQGVRLLSVTGKGLTDIVVSFAGKAQTVEINRARRADVLNSVTDGYGLKTSVLSELYWRSMALMQIPEL